MRATVNDILRALVALCVLSLGLVLSLMEKVKIRTFFWNQQRLRRQYRIDTTTPVLTYGPELEDLIDEAFQQSGQRGRFAFTSGTTAKPKGILYSPRRLRRIKRAYIDVFARCCWSNGIRQTGLYVFGSFDRDFSLTSMLLEEKRCPSYLSTLQAPYRLQKHHAIQSLLSRYSPTAIRLWILTVANPGALYSTNPSTLSNFLDELTNDWQRSTALVRDWYEQPQAFGTSLHKVFRRIQSRASSEWIELIAKSNVPLTLKACAPAISAYMCWVGGYVKPFVDRLASCFSAEHYRQIPMYSMSTETLETLSHFEDGEVSFLPLATEVFYEFIEEGREDDPKHLLTAAELQVGKNYSMVVSDPYGLRRYQTGDLFECKGHTRGVPDLRFVRRRNLEYSFTGEKLTSEQVSEAFDRVRRIFSLRPETFLACLPSQPVSEPIPHYKTIVIDTELVSKCIPCDRMAARCDQFFSDINCEYRNKRETGRLGPVRVVQMSPDDFFKRTTAGGESQFKFLPLYRTTWESFQGELSTSSLEE